MCQGYLSRSCISCVPNEAQSLTHVLLVPQTYLLVCISISVSSNLFLHLQTKWLSRGRMLLVGQSLQMEGSGSRTP